MELSIADSIWLEEDNEFIDDYLEVLKEYHGAKARELSFGDPESSAEINEWVSDATEEMIEDIYEIGEPAPPVLFVLINAIYFHGEWMEDFDPEETKDKEFTLDDGTTREVAMMQRESEGSNEYQYYDGEGFESVRIPYGEDASGTAMYIFVPDDSLDDFYARLDGDNWDKWMEGFSSKPGTIGLPRFEIGFDEDLIDPLQEMGMEEAFYPGEADFSAISPTDIFVDEVRHVGEVEVDEKGTEAAAVTVVEGAMGEGPEPFEVMADRPFFFVIRDDNAESILFAGALADPM